MTLTEEGATVQPGSDSEKETDGEKTIPSLAERVVNFLDDSRYVVDGGVLRKKEI